MHTLIGASSTSHHTASTNRGVSNGRSAAQSLTSIGEDARLVALPQRHLGKQSTLAQMQSKAFEPLHSHARPTSAPIASFARCIFVVHE
jgi:hypothetical protein